jgi:transcriptional regulator with XRE-family HTH domain
MNFNLNRLSDAEELWLWRMRQPSTATAARGRRSGTMTQAEAAKFLGLSLTRYATLEAGRRITFSIDELPALAFLTVPRESRPELSLREQLILARRRSGLHIRDMMREVRRGFGLSHTRILACEDKADYRLIDFWQARGFTGFNMPKLRMRRAA